MAKRAVRIQPDLDQRMQKAAKERGYRTPSAFIRAAIESEVKSRNEIAAVEEQTAASVDRLVKELRRVLRSQQALFALVDALTKAFLTASRSRRRKRELNRCPGKGPLYTLNEDGGPVPGQYISVRDAGSTGARQ
jgi:predicted transcriptional regulator